MELLRCPSISVYAPKITNNPSRISGFLINQWNLNNLGKNLSNCGGNRNFLSVVGHTSSDGGLEGAAADTAVVVEKPPSELRRFEVSRGSPMPFGATARDGGVNFAISSGNATAATLCLISLADFPEKRVSEQILLNPLTNKTGDVWHVFVKGNFQNMLYGYRFDGKFSLEDGHYFDSSKVLLDPYAKAIVSRGEFGALGIEDECWPPMACMVPSATDEFDWEGDLPLKLPQKDLIIYEMHVRGFTRHESSKTNFPGTYRGVVEKLDYLKELGVNCIELMPCHEFNELEYYSYNSILGDYK